MSRARADETAEAEHRISIERERESERAILAAIEETAAAEDAAADAARLQVLASSGSC